MKQDSGDYSSPPHKLLKLFKEGRDSWKEKTREAKKQLKLKRNRITFLEESKAKLKSRVEELEETLIALHAELSDLKGDSNRRFKEKDEKKN
jgi:chromosome segregation ATPase